jgi:quinol monooxygenase YgiN
VSTLPQAPAPQLVVVNRFRVSDEDADDFAVKGEAALAALAERPGHLGGHLGRNVDEPDLWLVTTTWVDIGSYRRALSAYDVKVTAVPLLSQAVDEPSAYEQVLPGVPTNEQHPRDLR